MIKLFRTKRRYRFTPHINDPTPYLAKINQYNQECGCSMSAMFTVLALLTVIIRTFALDWTTTNIIGYGLTSLLSIFIAGGIGKLLGISIAQIRLQLLYNHLVQKQYLEPVSLVEKGNSHVNLYQMGR